MDFSEVFKAARTNTQKPVKDVTIDVRESASTEEVQEKHKEEHCEHVQWETGFWKRFPWIGASAILSMLVCIALDGVILGTSDEQYQQQWPAHQKWDMLSEKWKTKTQIGPHVLLAIVNTVTNVALAIAIGHGVAIAWWRRVLKGSTIEDLHRSWSFASSVLELLTAGSRFNYIALAALMAKVALVDNVLLQQAVSTVRGYYELTGTTIHLPMATILPPFYAGVTSGDEFAATVAATGAFSWDTYYFDKNSEKISLQQMFIVPDVFEYDSGCKGLCSGKFKGAGFHWDCGPAETGKTFDINPTLAAQNSQNGQTALWDAYFTALQKNASAVEPELGDLWRNPVLSIEVKYIMPGVPSGSATFAHNATNPFINETLPYGTIGVQMLWANISGLPDANGEPDPKSSTCTGNTFSRFCRLRPSVVEYTLDVTNVIDNETLSDRFASTSTSGNGISMGIAESDLTPEYEAWNRSGLFKGQFKGYRSDPEAYRPSDRPSDRAGHDSNTRQIATWMQFMFSSGVNLEWLDTPNFVGYVPNMMTVGSSSTFPTSWVTYDPNRSCTMTTIDPMEFIGQTLNNLMVRSSLRAASQFKNSTEESYQRPLEEAVQFSNTTQNIPSLYYKTDWRWGAAAMCVVFLCVLCVLPSYWGFWELGRKVTLGPIEVAGAFQAPIMEHPIVATHGEVNEFVKEIGQRQVRYGQVEGQQRLAVANPTEVTRPGKMTPPSPPSTA